MSKSQTAKAENPSERHERIRIEASRETVESVVVAIILALLFRAFVAEAFVIPTGSMAPALMGAHKDIFCPECGIRYQVGASLENPPAAGIDPRRTQQNTVVGSVCPNCHKLNPLDLAGEKEHETFAGDRILVSKFAYALSDPERWDVIVFKYPGNPKQNYIKRLVGLPNETLRIRFGDVFARPKGSEEFEILRKPHDKVMAMSHVVHDTAYQSATLAAANYPSNWQPWEFGAKIPPSDSWRVTQEGQKWSATVEAPENELKYLRFYHRWPDESKWKQAVDGVSLAGVDPYSSYTITDFYPYDAYINVDTEQVYDYAPGSVASRGMIQKILAPFFPSRGEFRPDYVSGDLDQFGGYMSVGRQGTARIGYHWVGDLIVEADVLTEGDQGELVLELIESAVTFICRIDLKTGIARLEIEEPLEGSLSFAKAGGAATDTPTAQTKIRGGKAFNLRMANCDDQIYVWVNGSPIEFDQPTTFNMSAMRLLDEQRPHISTTHPMDAAPVALAVSGTKATVERLQVMRDKYYIAVDRENSLAFNDYKLGGLEQPLRADQLQRDLQMPQNWETTVIFDARRTVDYELNEDQFFPMGDNSPESEDARCWIYRFRKQYTNEVEMNPNVDPDAYKFIDDSFVTRDLLVGKALMVFWPHTWNSPVPFTPNFSRIGFIR